MAADLTDPADRDLDGSFSSARITARDEDVLLPSDDYREFLYPHDDPAIADFRGMDYLAFADEKKRPPFVQDLLAAWQALYDEPFVGITADGTVQDGLYPLDEGERVDAATRAARMTAAERALAALTDEQQAWLRHPLDSPQWRAWSNPEFVIHRVGLRLEDLSDRAAEALLDLVAACLSPEGNTRVREAMSLNGYLGELVDLPAILNDRSYSMSLFGDPSVDGAWGWQLFGHHVAVNFMTVAGRDVAAPVFLGAEPALTGDERPPLFAVRERLALELAASFTAPQRADAVVYASVLDPAMPAGRLHPADERHVAGAFRDNRVVPYEGVVGSRLDERQWQLVEAIVDDALLVLVASQRAAAVHAVSTHRDQTHIAWYGATDGSQPFYLRIQSPVVLTELDHHAGVWLSNRLPARFHVHTTLRLPNGNDYAKAYLAQVGE